MPGHDIIVIGASAGGIEAISDLLVQLPENLQAAIFIVIHIPSESPSMLAEIFNRRTPLTSVEAKNGEEIKYGYIYVAPPGHHLLLKDGIMITSRGPKENRARPAIDPLFRSAAAEFGPRVIGILLSGLLDDGVSGLNAIKNQKGITLAQDPDDALFSDMPQSAINSMNVDHILPVKKMGALITRLVSEQTDHNSDPPEELKDEVKIAESGTFDNHYKPNPGYVYSCPECNGPMTEFKDGNLIRYRCITGHAYTQSSLLSQQTEVFEAALFAALRILEERANLLNRLSAENKKGMHSKTYTSLRKKADDAKNHANTIRDILINKETN
jgi:two-component system chemotaxis response regulator CheB